MVNYQPGGLVEFRRQAIVVKLLIRRLDSAVAVRLFQSANFILPYLGEEKKSNQPMHQLK